jgi:hypothetical protein
MPTYHDANRLCLLWDRPVRTPRKDKHADWEQDTRRAGSVQSRFLSPDMIKLLVEMFLRKVRRVA